MRSAERSVSVTFVSVIDCCTYAVDCQTSRMVLESTRHRTKDGPPVTPEAPCTVRMIGGAISPTASVSTTEFTV